MLSDRMTPMAGCSGDRPKPRKVMLASWRMAWGNCRISPVRNWGSRWGSRCRRTIWSRLTAQLFRHPDVGGLLELEHLPPEDPGQGGPVAEGHAGHHAGKALAAGQGDEHHQQDVGNTHHQVDEPGYDGIHPPAQSGGSRSQDQGHHGADRRRQHADPDAEGQPGEGAGEHVPPHPVGAEEVPGAGGLVLAGKVGGHSLSGQQQPRHRHGSQEYGAEAQQGHRALSPVEMAHVRAAPLRILGSTTP